MIDPACLGRVLTFESDTPPIQLDQFSAWTSSESPKKGLDKFLWGVGTYKIYAESFLEPSELGWSTELVHSLLSDARRDKQKKKKAENTALNLLCGRSAACGRERTGSVGFD